MADSVLSSVASVYANLRKVFAATGYVVKVAAGDLVTASPIITSGSGAPSAAQPNGSLYLRTGGSNGDDSLYMRIGGAWKALQGETA